MEAGSPGAERAAEEVEEHGVVAEAEWLCGTEVAFRAVLQPDGG